MSRDAGATCLHKISDWVWDYAARDAWRTFFYLISCADRCGARPEICREKIGDGGGEGGGGGYTRDLTDEYLDIAYSRCVEGNASNRMANISR